MDSTVLELPDQVFDFSLQTRALTLKEEITIMGNIQECLDEAMKIDGAVGVALVDWDTGMCLGTAQNGSPINLEIAAAGNTAVVRSKMNVMQSLSLRDNIEDILITLGQQYHLIRLLSNHHKLFLYLVLTRSQANLALARYKLIQIEGMLKV